MARGVGVALDDGGQRLFLGRRQVLEALDVATVRHQHRLVRPDGPPRHHYQPIVVDRHDPLLQSQRRTVRSAWRRLTEVEPEWRSLIGYPSIMTSFAANEQLANRSRASYATMCPTRHPGHLFLQLAVGVVEQEGRAVALKVFQLVDVLDARLVGHERRSPDLAVRVRVGAAHGGALVLEDLHPVVVAAQLHHLLDPPASLTSIDRLSCGYSDLERKAGFPRR